MKGRKEDQEGEVEKRIRKVKDRREMGFFGGLGECYDIALIQSFKCEVTT